MERINFNSLIKNKRDLVVNKQLNMKSQETEPKFIKFDFEKVGDILPEQEKAMKQAFNQAGVQLEKEYSLTSPMKIGAVLISDEKFREGSSPTDPNSKKYCFLLRDYPNKVYCNADVFKVLPNEASTMVKHETAHTVVASLVNDKSKYNQSYFLEEGSAGLDGATDKLIAKIKTENIKDLPDPVTLKTIGDIKELGSDTNKEPFTNQLGYLMLFSVVDFLKKRHGVQKIVEVYKKLDENTSLEESYHLVCGEEFSNATQEWQSSIAKLTK